MAYRVNGIIVIDDSRNLSAGIATATEFDGKVSSKAITDQTAGSEADVSGADEVLIYDTDSGNLLRVSVDEFIEGSGIGTIVSEFGNLSVTGVSTVSGVEINAGIVTASSPTGVVTFYGDGSGLTNLPASQGATGPAGAPGGLGFSYTYDDNAVAGAASGTFRTNSILSSSTSLYISDEDGFGNDLQALFSTVSSVTNTPQGYITLTQKDDPSNYYIYSFIAGTDQTGYYSFPISVVDSTGTTFPDNTEVTVTFSLSGNQGATGPEGPTGPLGDLSNVNLPASPNQNVVLRYNALESEWDGIFTVPILLTGQNVQLGFTTSFFDFEVKDFFTTKAGISMSPTGIITAARPSVGVVTYYGDGSNLTGIDTPPPATISTTPPTSPEVGELWWNDDNGRLYVYYNDGSTSQWVDASPEGYAYSNPDVDAHLNVSSASADQLMSWSGTDYTWIEPFITFGSALPQGAVAADRGALYAIDSGLEFTGLYVKRGGGSTNLGWRHSSAPEYYAVFDASASPGNGVITPFKTGGGLTITRTGAGRYTVAFTTAMSDENYLIQMTVEGGASAVANASAVTTTGFNIQIGNNTSGAANQTRCYLSIISV